MHYYNQRNTYIKYFFIIIYYLNIIKLADFTKDLVNTD